MVIIEFKKLFFSKSTFLILLLLTFIASLSFYESHLNYQEFVQMEQSKDEDINLSAVKQFLHENKALSYLFRFIFQSEYYQLFVMALFAFIGIHLSAEPLKRLNSGYGNLIMTRTQYCAFYRDLLIAQSVYLTILLFLHFFCILVLALALNSFEMGIGFFQGSSFGPVAGIAFLLISVALCIFLSLLVNTLTSALYLLIRNIYILQAIPLVGFLLLPLIIGSTIANLFPSLRSFFLAIIPYELLYIQRTILTGNFHWSTFSVMLLFYLFLIFVALILFSLNRRTFGKWFL